MKRPRTPRPAKPRAATGLLDALKAGVEALSGHCLNDVKVHYNSTRPARLQAHAHAQGTPISVDPGSSPHVPDEAWHLAMQAQGRVLATTSAPNAMLANDDVGRAQVAAVMSGRGLESEQSQSIIL
jgi:hypothetical protein